MSEEEKIKQSLEDGKSERPEEVNENISQQETVEQSEAPIETSDITISDIPNMEVHHHPHVEKKNFKEYFLEFLMIFLAVTMGFIAENIREGISDTSKEKEYVRSLYDDMQRDSINIGTTVYFAGRQINKIDSLIYIINQPLPDSNEINAAYFCSRIATRAIPFEQADRTIQQLNNSGNFRLIKNVALADSIIEYEKNIAAYRENHAVGMEERQLLYPFISIIFDANVFQTMVDSTNHIQRTSGLHSINNGDKKLNNQFIYYLHQIKSTIAAEKINLLSISRQTSAIREIIIEDYKTINQNMEASSPQSGKDKF